MIIGTIVGLTVTLAGSCALGQWAAERDYNIGLAVLGCLPVMGIGWLVGAACYVAGLP